MKLYSYWRSTTTYRVRAALTLKGLAFPKIQRVEAACLSHPAIAAAHPDTQPDAKAV